jgi:hypothetical protein
VLNRFNPKGQKVAVICKVWALGLLGGVLLSPSKKAMLSTPPPNSGAVGLVAIDITVKAVIFCPLMWLRRTVFGSSKMACVIVPALMKEVRSCGSRAVPWAAAVWLWNGIGGPTLRQRRISSDCFPDIFSFLDLNRGKPSLSIVSRCMPAGRG